MTCAAVHISFLHEIILLYMLASSITATLFPERLHLEEHMADSFCFSFSRDLGTVAAETSSTTCHSLTQQLSSE